MIKNYLSLAVMALLPVAFNAQDGKVGINTDEPTRTLDVNGDLRVRTIEKTTDFAGFLTPSSNGDETNVLKLASFKTGQTFKAEMKEDLIGGGVTDLNVSNKITDNKWKTVAFATNKSDYAEVKSNNTIYITKSGFYNITVSAQARIDKADSASANFGSIDMAFLRAFLSSSYNGKSTHLASDVTTVIKGGKIAIAGSNTEPYAYNPLGNKVYYLNINTSNFFLKDTIINLQLFTYGLPGVVNDVANFRFTANTTNVIINKIL